MPKDSPYLSAKRCATSSSETSRSKNRFCDAVSPAISSICDFFRPSSRLSSSTMALLAFPFSGDCVTDTRSTPSSWPLSSLRRALACARSVNPS